MAVALLASPVAARCIGSSDPLIYRMELEIGRDPAAAVELIDKEIARTAPARTRRLAELNLAKSQALYMSGSPYLAPVEKARSIADDFAPTDNIGLYLRITDAVEQEPGQKIAADLRAIAPDIEALPAGSRARTCRETDLAFYNDMVEQPREAMQFAIEAYRNADGHATTIERAKAASVLAYLMSSGHDFDYANELHSEAYAIQRELGLSDLASNEVLLRGYTHLERGDWKSAVADFQASAREARSYGNQYAIDYALLGVCEAALEGDLIELAAPACERAHEGLAVTGDRMGFPATRLLAKLRVEQGDSAAALRLIDPLVAGGKGAASTLDWIMALKTRAQALSNLGRNAQAYDVMRRADEISSEMWEGEVQSGVAAMQARFQNEELQRRLSAEERASNARLRLAIAVIAGSVTTLALLGALIFSLLRHRRKFRRLAMTDPLTGLANRRATLERAEEALRAIGMGRPRASIALLDIDHFKSCNDRFGHDAGDAILREFARIVQDCVRPTDIVGRWGGEEFVLVFPATHVREAAMIIDRIRVRAARKPFDFANEYRLEFSAGIAMLHESDDKVGACITLADKRLYAAKAQGRDQTCIAGAESAAAPPLEARAKPGDVERRAGAARAA
ncbi:GGDEF domain-containing protein [Alteriqipengyuania lutimaris]|uniref:diguanylate cyclase n=1 Tax=Alteriqipengyuania lutimaris TaxID=1538146 RepID=A0A395LQK9_9SPHN|nr:GGDEF domain-containing protein [Alteriqipengyuania lutimaris]MBB3034106.1 diguanylate cyclase (GGDEF)-like protein [Alteriqipengyuania lutimaris]RDS76960.1 diguanylate cyclase [Alteriqipengyuania lutimaris]